VGSNIEEIIDNLPRLKVLKEELIKKFKKGRIKV